MATEMILSKSGEMIFDNFKKYIEEKYQQDIPVENKILLFLAEEVITGKQDIRYLYLLDDFIKSRDNMILSLLCSTLPSFLIRNNMPNHFDTKEEYEEHYNKLLKYYETKVHLIKKYDKNHVISRKFKNNNRAEIQVFINYNKLNILEEKFDKFKQKSKAKNYILEEDLNIVEDNMNSYILKLNNKYTTNKNKIKELTNNMEELTNNIEELDTIIKDLSKQNKSIQRYNNRLIYLFIFVIIILYIMDIKR